jgi:hypothetical protein
MGDPFFIPTPAVKLLSPWKSRNKPVKRLSGPASNAVGGQQPYSFTASRMGGDASVEID